MADVELPDETLDDEAAEGVEADDSGSRAPARLVRLRRFGLKLAVAAMSVVLTLGVVEVVFRLLGYEPVYDVYSDPDDFYRADPVLGWSYAPGARDEYVGPRPFPIEFRTEVRINSLGLRGPDLAPVPPGGLRVLILGDSWVAGLEVPEGRTYSSLLEEELTDRFGVPVQVVNAGVRGYGTDQALLLYRERLRGLDPDFVIHHTTGNDPEDNTVVHRMHRTFSKPAFLLEADGRLRPLGRPVHQYPQCSEYRVVDGEVRRVDGRRARAFCWLQTRLSDHSAFFSFVTERLHGNPDLVRRLYGLGFPEESRPPGAREDEEEEPAATPTTAPSTTERPATSDPATEPSTTEPPLSAPPSPEAGAGQRSGLDYAHLLTSVLVRELAADVRDDGAVFALVGHSNDVEELDVAAFERDGIETMPIDDALTEPSRILVPNDGHPNELGHRRIAHVLADQLQPHLESLLLDGAGGRAAAAASRAGCGESQG